ncbi:MAG: substrate-binding domain-containing protein [Rhodospirillaceae bacterium]|nr:substrate-binding domain-containing protein [Rhodospirillales bacterium]
MSISKVNVGVEQITQLIAAATAGKTAIHLRGSENLAQVLRVVVERFMDDYPGTLLALSTGGTVRGFKALIDGTCEMALASSAISDEQSRLASKAKIHLRTEVIGSDNILPLVHTDNPLPALTLEQMRRIFAGRVTNWAELGGNNQPITVMVMDPSSGTAVTWREQVLAGIPLSTRTVVVRERESALRVAADPGAISYRAEILPTAKGARPITLLSGHGPHTITRDLMLVVRDPAPPLAAQFLAWVTSPEGRNLLRVSQDQQIGAAR